MRYSQVEIGSVVTLKQGFAINKNTKHHMADEKTDLPLLRIADMKDGSRNVFVKDTIPEHFIAKSDDIIYTRTGQVGLVFINQYGVVHNNCFTVTPNNENVLLRKYLYYALQSKDFYTKANNLASGAAQPDLPHGAFNSIKIYLPPLGKQNRIADTLSTYDNLIENNQKQIKLLEEAAQRLYKEWFVDLRFPGYENTKIVDGVPAGWRKFELSEIAKLSAGGDRPKEISTHKTQDYVIPVYSNGSENEGLYGYTNKSTINENCITISARGNVGYACLRRKPFVPIVRLIVAIPPIEYLEYLFFYLKNMRFKSNGAAQQQITVPMIKDEEIILPTVDILTTFKNEVSPIFDLIDKLKIQIETTKEARDRLLPKLMSGELEV